MNDTKLIIVAVAAAVTAPTIPLQKAEARPNFPIRGCDPDNTPYNASKGRCFSP